MPATTLTQKAVEAAKPEAARREIPDALVPGLRLVVQPSGVKSWAVRYRHAGAPKKLVLGPLAPVIPGVEPEPTLGLPLTLKGARDVARQQLQVLATGRDPSQEKRAAKRLARDPDQSDRDLVRTVVAQFLGKYLRPRAKPGYYRAVERILTKDVVPVWGDRRVQDVRRRDVLDLLDSVVERGAPVQANRVLAAVRKLFGWAVSRDMLTDSPVRGVKAPTPESHRERTLDDAELRLVWLASGEVGFPFGTMTRLLMLTGTRRDEAAGLRRSEVSAGGNAWTLPPERTKNRRQHTLHLSTQARAVVESAPSVVASKDDGADIPRHKGLRDLVLSTNGRAPVSGYHKGKVRIDAAMLAIAKREAEQRGHDLAEVSLKPWRWHDLRHTMVTGMARLGVDLPVIERCVNHVSGSFGGVKGVYQHYTFEKETRAAFDAWGRYVEAISSGRGADVVPMRQSRRARAK